jgi:pimeloyl-ACP methyl ester carboxylesterase
LLMLPGLTRNARDFESLAERYAGDWRVIAAEFRGRGDSEWDPVPARYTPGTYATDVIQLLDELAIEEAVFFGTSLGGLVTMIVVRLAPDKVAGVLLNDIGPELDQSGIDRIKMYVGKGVVFQDWHEATSRIRARSTDVYPDYGDAEWLRFARRICRETEHGVELDYDMAIADPFNAGNTGEVRDGWPYYRALAGRPVLVLRGGNSDLLEASVAERMATEIPDVEVVTVPNVGHPPDLDEPESVAAIDRLLERVLRR